MILPEKRNLLKAKVFLLTLLILPQFGHCFYNPSSGRWLSRDPIQEKGGRNLYAFTMNSLLNIWDPLGLRGGPVALNCYCCECAEDIWLSDLVPYEKSRLNGNPGSYFQVNILLSYRIVRLVRSPQAAKYKWEEKSNRPTPGWTEKGQKPNEWANLWELDSRQIPRTHLINA